MQNRIEAKVRCQCPVDGAYDIYDLVIDSNEFIQIENIKTLILRFKDLKMFQEDLTKSIAQTLSHDSLTSFTVKTIGYHSGVKLTVTI
jgi:NADPH-dependent 7-cyano-7-deazaguanine reductase QueF